jgi:hypothetical protein
MNNKHPNYPVIHSSPPVLLSLYNLEPGDLLRWFETVALCLSAAWISGKPFRKLNLWSALFVGNCGGFLLCVQRSAGRLSGKLPNEKQVKKYPFRLDTEIPMPATLPERIARKKAVLEEILKQ